MSPTLTLLQFWKLKDQKYLTTEQTSSSCSMYRSKLFHFVDLWEKRGLKRQSKHVYFMNSTCQRLKLVLVETKLINMFKTWSFSKYESLRNTLLLVRCNWLWLFRSCCVSHVKSESNEVKLFSRVSWLSMFLVRLMCAVLFHLLLHNHPMTCFCGPLL